jgi:D-alanyl-lipoteichoic acid acyltransferase DltB (MBOAT superfamily)
MRNFAYPYFSRDIAEFWRRWHISLSTWFRDYVYIPLGGSYTSQWRRIRNILVTFTISGLWHGASWNFVFWGFLNGLYYIPLMLAARHKVHTEIIAQHAFLPSFKETGQLFLTFALTCIAWVFFRATDMSEALEYLQGLAALHSGRTSVIHGNVLTLGICGTAVLMMFGIEWLQRRKAHGLERIPLPAFLRWTLYIIIALIVLGFFGAPREFIYFQF